MVLKWQESGTASRKCKWVLQWQIGVSPTTPESIKILWSHWCILVARVYDIDAGASGLYQISLLLLLGPWRLPQPPCVYALKPGTSDAHPLTIYQQVTREKSVSCTTMDCLTLIYPVFINLQHFVLIKNVVCEIPDIWLQLQYVNDIEAAVVITRFDIKWHWIHQYSDYVRHRLDSALTRDTAYLALAAKLWVVYSEHFGES